MSIQASLPKVITVTLDDGTVIEVKKLALGKYIQLTSIFERLLTDLFDELQALLDTDSEEAFLKKVPQFVIACLPEVMTIISVVTGLSREYIEESLGLDEAIEIIIAMVKTNNFTRIAEQGKNLIALFRRN